jgi:hypothetical protein
MRNLANIGFEIQSLEDLQALAAMVCSKGKSYRVGRNQYYRFTDPSGAELWTQVDENDEIAGMNAHFNGSNSVAVALVHAQAYETRPLDGTFEAQALQADAGLPKGARTPTFAFDLPDAHMVPAIVMPAEASVQLVGFAREVHCYETVEDFRAANPGLPLEGLMAVDADRPPTADGLSSLVRLDGIVMAAGQLHNTYSNRPFYWMEVKTAIGKIDVVASSRSMPSPPGAGQIFDGQVRLSGRVAVHHAVELKPGLVERFFWGAHSNKRIP